MQDYTTTEQAAFDAAARETVVTLPSRGRQQSADKDRQRDTHAMMRVAERRGFATARRDLDAKHPNTGVVWDYPAVAMPARKVTKGKGKRSAPFFGMAEWYKAAMQHQDVTPAEFAHWRRYVVNLTAEECGALFRVSRRTIDFWEKGASRIPFAAWYVMHCHLQNPAVWLSRAGFTDLRVEYRDGVARLCSVEFPDIQFTHGQLVYYAQAMAHLSAVEAERDNLKSQLAALTRENTELRRMFKTNQVTKELERMQGELGDLLRRLHTADVYAFPIPAAVPADTLNRATGTV